MLHILPSNKIPVPVLPLDLFISNTLSYLKKVEKQKNTGKFAEAEIPTKTMREEMEDRANLQGLFMIPEYEFEHCISSLTPGDWQNENGI